MASKPQSVGGGRWTVLQRLGAGSFGEIYSGEEKSSQSKVAIKFEEGSTKTPQLLSEGKILRHLRELQGVPQVHWYGTEEGFNILVMTLLGPSMEDVLNNARRKLSLRGTVQAAEEMVQRVEEVHTMDIIHRDIKPDNFLTGKSPDSRALYIIDFGLAKRYRDVRTKIHIPYKEEKALVGTARYASLNNHLGLEQSRRDDLEALGYIFVYFLKGKLPWQGLARSSHQDKYRGIMESKMRTPIAVLCKDLCPEFCSYLNYCRGLKFDETPNYAYLKNLLRNVCITNKIASLGKFDWDVEQSEMQSEASSQRKQKARQRRKSVNSLRKKSVAAETPRANRTQGACGDSVSTEGGGRLGPVISQKTRDELNRLLKKESGQRPKSNCRVF